MSETTKVLVGKIDAGYIVMVNGRGTMEYCSDLFQFLSTKIDNEKIDDIYFELSNANYLDSSFIGVIVSIQKKCKKQENGDVIILNPSQKVKEILETMGLLEIMPLQEGKNYQNMEMSKEIESKLEKNYHDIELLLQSHQNLMELNDENRKRFSLVRDMLEKEKERFKNE